MTFHIAEQQALAVDQVAIAISNGSFGTHLGIVYCLDEGVSTLIHLAWHKSLMVETLPLPTTNQHNQPSAIWLTTLISMSETLASQVVALIHTMGEQYAGEKNQGIDYGINFYLSQNAIKANGDYILEAGADGLTCATFVNAIFAALKIPLVELGTWNAGTANEAWGRAVICFLLASEQPTSHVNAVAANNLGLRLRPEEVAAAAEQFDPLKPAAYKNVQVRSEEIAAQVDRECGPWISFPKGSKYEACQRNYINELTALHTPAALSLASDPEPRP